MKLTYDLFTQVSYVAPMRTRTLPVLLLVAFAAPAHAEVVSGPAHAVDGDTIVVYGKHVRLASIDAPELDQSCQRDGQAWACGEEAKRQLDSMIAGQTVYCQGEEVDQYGRLLGTCSANRMNLNATMVEYGWATAYRAYTSDYLAQEHRARSAKAGIWKSEFALPEQHRIAAREASRPAATVAPARSTMRRSNSACDIKGNRSRRGDWIYHLPGMQYYEQTRPEEIFCSEADAIAAGYRRSKV
ncbi:MAG TPA: hypothetical protein DCL34_01500 [Erythrobacter sp.]|nr:thermonuclease family protein [Erythrobacter sp. A30-3]HAG35479.1 hypothetical protein [Erythrobacter sp.]